MSKQFTIILFTILLLMILKESGWGQIPSQQTQVSEATSKQNKLLPVARNGKWGLVDLNGNYILENKYDYIEYHAVADLFSYHYQNRKGIIKGDGQIYSKAIYEDLFILDSVWISTKKDGHWNLQKGQNSYLPYQYDSVRMVAKDIFILYEKHLGKLYHTAEKTPRNKRFQDAITIGKGIVSAKGEDNKTDFYSQEKLNLLVQGIDTFYYPIYQTIIASTPDGEALLHIDSLALLGEKKASYRYLNSFYYLCGEKNGETRLFDRSTSSFYKAPELTSIENLNFPLLFYWKYDKRGLWNLETGKHIIKPIVETITPIKGGYLTGSYDQFGIYARSGKEIIPTIYDNILTYDDFFVVWKNGMSGLFNLSGKSILPLAYDQIKVYDNNIKCYKNQELTVIKFNADGSIQSKKTYTEYMSITIDKERLPERRSASIAFEGPAGSNKMIQGSIGGWFQPIILREKEDTVVKVRGKWGLKDQFDSVYIKPQFTEIQRSQLLITKCFYGQPIPPNAAVMTTNPSRIKTIQAAKGINVAYNAPFVLVNDSSRSLLSRKKYFEVYVEDFYKADFARAFDGEISLINRDGKPLRTKLNYFGYFQNNRLRICEGGQLKFTREPEQETVSNTVHYYGRLGAVLCSNTSEKAYTQIENGNWYILDPKGNQLNDTAFQYIEEFYHGKAIVKRNNAWGVIDTSMNTIVPIIYEKVTRVLRNDTSFFRVSDRVKAHYLYSRKNGQLNETSISSLEHYIKGKWFVKQDQEKGWTLMDTNFQNLSNSYDFVYPFNNGLSLSISNGRRTLLDETGQQILGFHKARKIIQLGGDRFGLVQKRGTTVLTSYGDTLIDSKNCRAVLASTDEYLIFENKYREIEILSADQNIAIPKNYKIVSFDLENKILLLDKNGKNRLYNMSTEKFISNKIDGAVSLGESTLIYRGKNGLFGYMSYEGDTLCQPLFKKLDPIKNGWAFAEEKKQKGPVNNNGEYLFTERVFRVIPLGEKYQYYTGKGIGIMDKYAQVIIPAGYKAIEMYNGFYKAQQYDLKYDIYDADGQKLNDKPYKDIKAISPDALIVRVNEFDYLYTGFINKSLAFQEIMPVSTDLYLLHENRLYGLYNSKGEMIIPVKYHQVELAQAHFQVSFFNSFGYYNHKGLALGDPRP